MAKLYYRYGAMGSSKTAQALMLRYNCEEQGKRVILVKPDVDSRDGREKIRSRVGLEAECSLFSEFRKRVTNGEGLEELDVVIVDEAQFLMEDDVDLLAWLVDEHRIDVFCYGLKTDFTGHLFAGSKRLLELADKIEEVKTMCWCGRKATMNARIDSNKNIVRSGEQVLLGFNDRYVALCREHYMKGEIR